MTNLRLLSLAVIFSSLCSIPSSGFAAVGLVSETGGSLQNSQFNQTLGWVFDLNTEVTLGRLGFYDSNQDGLAEAHDVGIWTSAGTLVASATVPNGTGGSLLGNFRYVNVPTVQLPVGQYLIGAHFGDGSLDLFVQDSSSIVTDAFVEYSGRAGNGPGFVFPTPNVQTGGTDFTAANFQFNVIPEPSSCILLVLASGLGLVGRRRLSQF